MILTSRLMTPEDATLISTWSYDAPYDFYNMDASEEGILELLNGSHAVVASPSDPVFGFYCNGSSAQVPVGHEHGVYKDNGNTVDLGLGMNPDLTGQGYGASFFQHILGEFRVRWPHHDIRLTVAEFNTRAIHLYENFGFHYVASFPTRDAVFQTMRLHNNRQGQATP